MNRIGGSFPNKAEGYDIRFKHPFSAQCISPSGGGKTTFVLNLIRHLGELVVPKIDRIVYCASEYQTAFDEFPHVTFLDHFDEDLVSKESLPGTEAVLMIVDDLMHTLRDSRIIGQIFCSIVHHRNLSFILLQNNYYPVGFKCGTDVNRNSHYKILWKNNPERLQTMLLGRSLFPRQSGFWNEMINDCFSTPYNYLVINNRSDADENVRCLSGIFPNQTTVSYIPRKTKKSSL